ncbi:hypothetical protein EON83_03190 [bacterium]|nr:MAG: hypothetical protein EON83_03190 [bacterium]
MKSFLRRLLFWGAFSSSVLLGGSTARAATFTVDTTTDDPTLSACTGTANDCSLRGALVQANSNPDADTIVLGSGISYTLGNGALPLSSAATIQGNNSTIAAGGANRILAILGASSAIAVSISDLTFSGGNPSGAIATGGAIDAKGVQLTLAHCTFRNNASPATGGAVASAALFSPAVTGSLTATDCTFDSNSGLNGSALSLVGVTATLNRCTFSANTASGSHGGAIYVTGTSATLGASNATLASNSASSAPSSGVVGGFGGAVQLTNCTLSGNSGSGGNFGLARFSTAPTFSARNTIFSMVSGASFDATLGAGFTSSGHNLFTDSPTQKVGSDLSNQSSGALFTGSIANNGGLVQTLALAATSPALEAGDDSVFSTLTTDARGTGFTRLSGTHVDIGAYERRANAAPVPALANYSLATWAGRDIINRPDRATDADGDTLTWSTQTGPSHGTLTVDPSDGLFLYTPTAAYTGGDSFIVKVSDGTASANVTYAVTVATAPVAGTRIYTALGDDTGNGVGAADYVPSITAPHGYTALLEAKFKPSEGPSGKWALSNRCVNGFTAPDIVRVVGGKSALSLAVGDGASAYTLFVGPNDVLHIAGFITPSETAANFNTALSQIVTAIKNTGSTLVVCNVPKVGDLPASRAYTPSQRAGINTIAQTLNTGITSVCSPVSVPVLDLNSDPDATDPTNLSADGFHPNNAGHQKLADKIWPLLTARVPLAPYIVGVTPTTATTARGATQTFALQVKDTNGFGTSGLNSGNPAINEVWFLANSNLNWDGGATFVYRPSNTDVTKGVLWGRLNGQWTQSNIGTGGTTVQSDGGSVNAALVTVSLDSDGTGFTVQLPVAAGLLSGVNPVWVRVQDPQVQTDLSAPAGSFGYVAKATWTVTVDPATNARPVLNAVTPPAGTTWSVDSTGYSQVRTVTLGGSDSNGVNDVQDLWLIVGPQRNWSNSGTLCYQPRYHVLWLRTDAGDAWLGPVAIGTAGAILENSSVRVDVSSATETRTANSVSVPIAMQIKNSLRGQPGFWGRIADQAGAVDSRGDDQGFVSQGTWTVGGLNAQNSAPTVESITPNSSNVGGGNWKVGVEREAVLDVRDADGAADIASAWLLAGQVLNWDQGATLIYTPSAQDPTKGSLVLRGDSGFLPAVNINGAQTGTLSNGHVSVRLNGVFVETTVDGHLKLHMPLTFAANMAKTLNVWGRAQDKLGATDPASPAGQTGYVLKTTWKVAAVANSTRRSVSAPSS